MRICTERWTKLAARGRFRFDAKARINNKDYTVISAPRIDRSLKLDVITNNIVIGAMVLYMSGSLNALTPKEASHHEKERN